jgi:hypothetical protein
MQVDRYALVGKLQSEVQLTIQYLLFTCDGRD